ncbi:MAG TPA: CoA-binding protein [Deltaproteobacteria bacterium]|nr:CoA-binding protein [Deltaproteobacteria bacterium]
MAHAPTKHDAEDVFERIFHPSSVAVIGVSSQGGGFGSGILDSLETMGFDGRLYAVNARGGEYKGRKLHRSVSEIPDRVDFAVVAVPARDVPGILAECRDRGVAGAEILSSGFSETGTPEGRDLEMQVSRIAREGIRVIGPNCFGVYCPRSGLTLLPGPHLSRESGPVAFLSQSGGMSIDLANIGSWLGVRFSKVVSYGNGADLRETELLDYLGADPDTGIVAMYIEGVPDGREFLGVLARVAGRKPVVVIKGGLSDAGARMVASHTGSMGGSRVIWESALRQAGAVVVRDLWDLAYTCLAFSLLPLRPYRGISVAGGGGALGVSAGDLAEDHGLVLPVFDEPLSGEILSFLPRPGSSANNPIDAANPFVGPDAYRNVFRIAASHPGVDLQVLIQLLHHYKPVAMSLGVSSPVEIAPVEDMALAMADVARETGKPVALVLPDYRQDLDCVDIEILIRTARKAFVNRGIPVFGDLGQAFAAVSRVSAYAARRSSPA